MRKRSQVEEQKAFVVPHDTLNESIVITAAITGDAKTRDRLLSRFQVDHFIDEENRAIWSGLLEIKRRALVFSVDTLREVVGDRVNYGIVDVLFAADLPANIAYHEEKLLWDRQRVTAARGPLSSLLWALSDTTEAPERVLALARSIVEALEAGASSRQLIYTPEAIVSETMNEIRRRMRGEAIYPFGIDGIDKFESGEQRMVPGTAPGGITIVTGLSGSAKSTLCANIALAQMSLKRKTLYGAWEVLAPMTLETMACIHLGWNRHDLLDPNGAVRRDAPLTPERLREFEEAAHRIAQYVVFVRNPFRRSSGANKVRMDNNLEVVQQIISDSGCNLAIFDLWSRCLSSRKPEDEEEALFRQQAIAAEEGVHCILAHQQRLKDLETRMDKRPSREGIKGSGAYVEVADNMIGAHRPAQWKNIADDRVELFILKQRFGRWPLGIEMDWDPDSGRISGGRSIEYDQFAETSMGMEGGALRSFADRKMTASNGGSRGQKRRA